MIPIDTPPFSSLSTGTSTSSFDRFFLGYLALGCGPTCGRYSGPERVFINGDGTCVLKGWQKETLVITYKYKLPLPDKHLLTFTYTYTSAHTPILKHIHSYLPILIVIQHGDLLLTIL